MARKGRVSNFLSAAFALGLVARRMERNSSQHGGTAHKYTRTDEPKARIQPISTYPNGPGRESPATGFRAKYQLAAKAISRFMEDDCTTMGAAIAYYTTFSIAPLLLIVISIVGLIFGRQAVQHEIQSQIQDLIGSGSASQIGAMVQKAGQQSSHGFLGAALGAISLFLGAVGAFTQLQASLNQVWRVKPDPKAGGIRNFVAHRLLSLGMILAVAFLLVVSLAVSAALSAFGSFMSAYLPHGFSGAILQALNFAVSLAIIAALFAAMFKALPDARIGWRNVWLGAGMTAVLFTIGKFLIGVYLGHGSTASAYGAAGSFVLVVLWIYYSSLIFLFGAEFTAVWSEAHAGSVQPKPGAVRIKNEEKVESRVPPE